MVTTTNAWLADNQKHFMAFKQLVNRNILAGVSIESGYLAIALELMALYDMPELNTVKYTFIQVE